MPLPPIRKIYQGIADRRQMFRLFDRHAERPNHDEGESGALYSGEWFEIARAEHDYMFDILPPLWMRGEMFALREFLTSSVTSVFYTLRIDGRTRHFHAYCDLAATRSALDMREEIVARESRPVKAMTRGERVEHIWSAAHEKYRGYAGETWPEPQRGLRIVQVHLGRRGSIWKPLEHLTDFEVAAKLPVHLRFLPEPLAA